MDAMDSAVAAVNAISDGIEALRGVDLGQLTSGQLTDLAGLVFTERDALDAAGEACHARVRARRDEAFETLGADATACCLAHRRRLAWLPSPGWWVHDDGLPHVAGYVHGADGAMYRLSDSRTCQAMWTAPAPIVIIRRADGTVVYPSAETTARRLARVPV